MIIVESRDLSFDLFFRHVPVFLSRCFFERDSVSPIVKRCCKSLVRGYRVFEIPVNACFVPARVLVKTRLLSGKRSKKSVSVGQGSLFLLPFLLIDDASFGCSSYSNSSVVRRLPSGRLCFHPSSAGSSGSYCSAIFSKRVLQLSPPRLRAE